MKNLNFAIKKLEQAIEQDRNFITQQYKITKQQVVDKITSPPIFLLAFVTGGLLGKQIKRMFKYKPTPRSAARKSKMLFLPKLLALSSEISVAINLFKRFKKLADSLIKKTDSNLTVMP